VVLAAERGPKAQLIVAASKDIAGRRVHAGNLVKELAPLIGGGGGGRPDLAQAGGKDPSGIDGLLARAYEAAEAALG
jgi:alanyl-tRNA synthetase